MRDESWGKSCCLLRGGDGQVVVHAWLPTAEVPLDEFI